MGVVTVMLQYIIRKHSVPLGESKLDPLQLRVVQAEILIAGLNKVGSDSLVLQFPNLSQDDIPESGNTVLKFSKESSEDSPIGMDLIMSTVNEYLQGLDGLDYAVMSSTVISHDQNAGFIHVHYNWTLQKEIAN